MSHALITSFQRAFQLPVPAFSAAVYQPQGYSLPKADWADIRRNGTWTRPRDFVGQGEDPLLLYHQALLNLYAERWDEIEHWIRSVGNDFALCCWCPYDRAAQRQLHEHGSFVCHTAVVGEVLQDHGVRVWYDEDRRRMKVLP